MENELVAFGGYCKAIEGGRLVGPLVHFGSPGATDLSRYRDYFTPRTNFDLDGCCYKSRIYYDHGLDPVIRKRRIGSGGMTKDAVAIWIEGQLDLRDEYMAGIYALAQRNKLSWSSGTVPHLVERKAIETPEGIVHEVLSWPLGLDASVTPRPADPRSIERLWRSLKYEDMYLKDYPDVLSLRQGISEYFTFYNTERPHQSL